MSTDLTESAPTLVEPGAAVTPRGGLWPLFAPKGVVVVGASSDPTKLGGVMAASLATYSMPVARVNARGGAGMHASVAEAVAALGAPAELAVLCVPAASCADVLRECAAAGTRAALICAGGFAESGGDGVDHQRRVMDAIADTGIRLLGPNTSGFFVPGLSLCASFVPAVADLAPGRISVVAASGGLNHALSFALERRQLGVRLGVGIGAGLDVTAADVLEHLAHDDDTRAIILHIETVPDGPALLAAVRTASNVKPVVAMVVGRHDVGEFAQSHTGALATSWRTTRALLRQAGAVVVDDEETLVTAASALASRRLTPHASPGVALVTAQAGPGLIIADALHEADVRMPLLTPTTQSVLAAVLPPMTYQANPVDTGRPGPRHHEVLSAVAADPNIDIVAVYGLTEPVVDLPRTLADATLGETVAVLGVDGTTAEVSSGLAGAARLDVPVTVGSRALAAAVSALVADARARDARRAEPVSEATADPPRLDPATFAWTEHEAKGVLDTLGVPTPARRVCRSEQEAQAALASLGGPVAVKLSDASVLHKSDVGGVRLGVRTAADMAEAVGVLMQNGATEFLVEQMAPAGVDLVVGARRDPVFGPVVVLGVGGIATEVYADVAIASIPARLGELERLPDQLLAQPLLDGFRGAAPVDRRELAMLLRLLGGLLAANEHLAEVEINPLRVTPTGLLALDAVLVAADDEKGDHDD
jgi:acyl-CoA synthetase (NDP forming)